MTMRIHRAVRTLSLLLALSMLLSVSAISSAAETPGYSHRRQVMSVLGSPES